MSIPGCRSAYFNVGNACLPRFSRISRVGPRVLQLAYRAFPLLERVPCSVYGGVLHLAADPFFCYIRTYLRSTNYNNREDL